MHGEYVERIDNGQSVVTAVGPLYLWTYLEWVKTTDTLSD